MCGGDYDPEGLEGCGITKAAAMAQAGFGDQLLRLVEGADHRSSYIPGLDEWRDALREEFRTNSHGLMPTKATSLANQIPDTFPDLTILRSYTHPLISSAESLKSMRRGRRMWNSEPDIPALVGMASNWFELWNKELLRFFRRNLWDGLVMRGLRSDALLQDERRKRLASGSVGMWPAPHENDGENECEGAFPVLADSSL